MRYDLEAREQPGGGSVEELLQDTIGGAPEEHVAPTLSQPHGLAAGLRTQGGQGGPLAPPLLPPRPDHSHSLPTAAASDAVAPPG